MLPIFPDSGALEEELLTSVAEDFLVSEAELLVVVADDVAEVGFTTEELES